MLGSRRPGNFRNFDILWSDRDRRVKREPLASRSSVSTAASDVSKLVKMDPSDKPIGRGGFGEVFLGVHRIKGPVALKRPFAKASLEAIHAEIENWMGLTHGHVLDFIGTCFLENHFHLVLPYVRNGNLFDYIKKHRYMDRHRILKETADAIAYLHSVGIIHGDIKANNILIGKSEEAYISDFGLSRRFELNTLTAIKGAGSTRWQAPELHDGAPRSFETDVYAFGITIAEVLKGEMPFQGLRDNAVILAVYMRDARPETKPLKSPGGMSFKPIWDVAKRCWCKNPAHRITMREAFARLQTRRSDNVTDNQVSNPKKPLPQDQSVGTCKDCQHIPCCSTISPLPPQNPGLNHRKRPKTAYLQRIAETGPPTPRSGGTDVANLRNASEMVSICVVPFSPPPGPDHLQNPPASEYKSISDTLEVGEVSPRRGAGIAEGGPASRGQPHARPQSPNQLHDQFSVRVLASGADLVNHDFLPADCDEKPPLLVLGRMDKNSSTREDRACHQTFQLSGIGTRSPVSPTATENATGRPVSAVIDDRAAVRPDGDSSPPPSRKRTGKKVIGLRGALEFLCHPRQPSGNLDLPVSFMVVSEIDKRRSKPRSRAQMGKKLDFPDGVGFYRSPRSPQTLGTPSMSFTVKSSIEGALPKMSVETRTPSPSSRVLQLSAETPSTASESILETPPDVHSHGHWIGPTIGVPFELPRSETNFDPAKAEIKLPGIVISEAEVEVEDHQWRSSENMIAFPSFNDQPEDRTPTQAAYDALQTPLQQKSYTVHHSKLNPYACEFSPRRLADPFRPRGLQTGLASGIVFQTTPAQQHSQGQHTVQVHTNTPVGIPSLSRPHTPHYPWAPPPYDEHHGAHPFNELIHHGSPYYGAIIPHGVPHAWFPNIYGAYLPPTWPTYGLLTPTATGGSWAPTGTPVVGTPHIYNDSHAIYPS